MPPVRPLTPTSIPHLEVMLTDDGSRTLRHSLLDETYHSGCGAISECWHVYLHNSGIAQLLATPRATNSEPVRVLELGFGTGMGWLVTAAAAEVHRAPLDYVSLETDLLPADVLAQINITAAVQHGIAGGWIPPAFDVMKSIEPPWLDFRASLPATTEARYSISPTNHLQLLLVDARSWLEHSAPQTFDAIYFDAFSPGTNPELWHEAIFGHLKSRLKPAGRLVSYCVSGAVRRALQNTGYQVERKPGPPGGKREVLVAGLR